MGTGHMPDIIF